MNKRLLVLVLVVLGVLRMFVWYFDILRFYNYPTSANEPNLKMGAKFIWTKLVEPKPLDFICFKVESDTSDYVVAMRLVAMSSDVLEIKRGNLFVNGSNIDLELNLRRPYRIENEYFVNEIKPKLKKNQFYYPYQFEDSAIVFIDDKAIKSNELDITPKILDTTERDELIYSTYNKYWNIDNFGPLVIPEGKYFVLGDNRGNSFDSRFIGLISKENVLGTIIYIYQ